MKAQANNREVLYEHPGLSFRHVVIGKGSVVFISAEGYDEKTQNYLVDYQSGSVFEQIGFGFYAIGHDRAAYIMAKARQCQSYIPQYQAEHIDFSSFCISG